LGLVLLSLSPFDQPGQALIAGNSHLYWQNQQQRQAEKESVFIEVICEDWY
jgi:hypothetical protein